MAALAELENPTRRNYPPLPTADLGAVSTPEESRNYGNGSEVPAWSEIEGPDFDALPPEEKEGILDEWKNRVLARTSSTDDVADLNDFVLQLRSEWYGPEALKAANAAGQVLDAMAIPGQLDWSPEPQPEQPLDPAALMQANERI